MVASLDSGHGNINPRCITTSARRNNELGINGRTSVTVQTDALLIYKFEEGHVWDP